ncbi:deoxyribodipyrimidine photo-lyase [Oceanicoccus sagamiensis]|uniref:Deoxyribodipyrimidine photo-lyase n=2 Tax=Oceanicoccus sagamiensis TaxID=716816 RepID=A0A1X9NGF7_9GAMM|nr:deoxyribodipyrimidine photo-lyase [Oceanicoccus sagamiensis]
MNHNPSHTLIWFRSDLRIHDNTALQAASVLGNPLIACFAITPEQWREHDMSAIKAQFIYNNLLCLQQQLLDKGIPLKIVTVADFKQLPAALLSLCQSCNVTHIFANAEYGFNEKQRDAECQSQLSASAIECHFFHDQTVLAPGTVTKADGSPYQVFTPFSKQWRRQLPWPPGIAPRIKTQARLPIEPDPIDKQHFYLAPAPPIRWPAGEAAAYKQLTAFADASLRCYQQRRDIPSIEGTSSLSPYLAIGVLSPRQCLKVAYQALQNISAGEDKEIQCWINELIWRDFYIHILDLFPRVSQHQAFKAKTEKLPWRYDKKDFQRWCTGQTGIPIVDAAMRQLLETGWMHNRLRMVTAMFLSKNLLIDWRWGERFFMQHLIDGYLASNNGGWQWSASTGTDAVPYFRVFNPVVQGQRFDADGEFIRRFVPELRHLDNREIHQPPLDLFSQTDYPAPMVDLGLSRQLAIQHFKALD